MWILFSDEIQNKPLASLKKSKQKKSVRLSASISTISTRQITEANLMGARNLTRNYFRISDKEVEIIKQVPKPMPCSNGCM